MKYTCYCVVLTKIVVSKFLSFGRSNFLSTLIPYKFYVPLVVTKISVWLSDFQKFFEQKLYVLMYRMYQISNVSLDSVANFVLEKNILTTYTCNLNGGTETVPYKSFTITCNYWRLEAFEATETQFCYCPFRWVVSPDIIIVFARLKVFMAVTRLYDNSTKTTTNQTPVWTTAFVHWVGGRPMTPFTEFKTNFPLISADLCISNHTIKWCVFYITKLSGYFWRTEKVHECHISQVKLFMLFNEWFLVTTWTIFKFCVFGAHKILDRCIVPWKLI
jgi:hypothetical protein